jgi:hypothetical protein
MLRVIGIWIPEKQLPKKNKQICFSGKLIAAIAISQLSQIKAK